MDQQLSSYMSIVIAQITADKTIPFDHFTSKYPFSLTDLIYTEDILKHSQKAPQIIKNKLKQNPQALKHLIMLISFQFNHGSKSLQAIIHRDRAIGKQIVRNLGFSFEQTQYRRQDADKFFLQQILQSDSIRQLLEIEEAQEGSKVFQAFKHLMLQQNAESFVRQLEFKMNANGSENPQYNLTQYQISQLCINAHNTNILCFLNEIATDKSRLYHNEKYISIVTKIFKVLTFVVQSALYNFYNDQHKIQNYVIPLLKNYELLLQLLIQKLKQERKKYKEPALVYSVLKHTFSSEFRISFITSHMRFMIEGILKDEGNRQKQIEMLNILLNLSLKVLGFSCHKYFPIALMNTSVSYYKVKAQKQYMNNMNYNSSICAPIPQNFIENLQRNIQILSMGIIKKPTGAELSYKLMVSFYKIICKLLSDLNDKALILRKRLINEQFIAYLLTNLKNSETIIQNEIRNILLMFLRRDFLKTIYILLDHARCDFLLTLAQILGNKPKCFSEKKYSTQYYQIYKYLLFLGRKTQNQENFYRLIQQKQIKGLDRFEDNLNFKIYMYKGLNNFNITEHQNRQLDAYLVTEESEGSQIQINMVINKRLLKDVDFQEEQAVQHRRIKTEENEEILLNQQEESRWKEIKQEVRTPEININKQDEKIAELQQSSFGMKNQQLELPPRDLLPTAGLKTYLTYQCEQLFKGLE